MRKAKKDELIKKSEVLLLIQNYIRSKQMYDFTKDTGIPQLYHIYSEVEKLKTEKIVEDLISENDQLKLKLLASGKRSDDCDPDCYCE